MPEIPRGTPAPVLYLQRPSTWLTWHGYLFRPGVRVLDLACGEGRHALRAAQRGAQVVGVDIDEAKLETAREAAERLAVTADFRSVDLTGEWPDLGVFDVVLMFDYLDRARIDAVKALVRPGGVLLMETFLDWQKALGWGPTRAEHLLEPGEIVRLLAPFEWLHGREVFEAVEGNKTRAIASIAAQRPSG
jgi:2-polyprenyl-3-methyl-5-hydroxy-6-metoxy-1,4-benzoquinol methylase